MICARDNEGQAQGIISGSGDKKLKNLKVNHHRKEAVGGCDGVGDREGFPAGSGEIVTLIEITNTVC